MACTMLLLCMGVEIIKKQEELCVAGESVPSLYVVAHMCVPGGRADTDGVAMMLVVNGYTPSVVVPVDLFLY